MPFDDDGFTPRSAAEIIESFETDAQSIFDVVNFSVSSLLWQYMKIHAIDEYYYETLLETCSEQMSIQNAVGEWLDKHGIECGIERKGAENAQGYVDVSATISSSDIVISEGAEFKSSLNSYLTDESNTIEYRILQTKLLTGESYDFFSSDYPYAEEVSQILDENLNVIPTSVWEFDETYNNNIHWLDGSIAYIQANENYYVQFNGTVTRRMEVTCVASGFVSNAKKNEIQTSVTYPYLTVDNSVGVSGGINKESNDRFRDRLLEARRRNFTLGKIVDIANNINGVRSAKAYQNTGVDQTSIADWDEPIIGTNLIINQYPIKYAQGFVPGNLVISLGKITIVGTAINSPPPIRCGVRLSTAGTGVQNYEDIYTFTENDLVAGNTGFQDINFILKYNGLDKTKTYIFDLWLKQSEDGITGIDFSTNYWMIRTSAEGYGGSNARYDAYQVSGGDFNSMGSGVDLMFKSWYGGAAYTTILSPDDGYGFENLKEVLENSLDYVAGGGLSPIGIQYVTTESSEIDIDIRGVIYIDELANFVTVRNAVVVNIETYLESLGAGDDVVYAEIEHQIMKHPQVTNQKELYIKRSDVDDYAQEDVAISDTEIADLGTRNLQLGVG